MDKVNSRQITRRTRQEKLDLIDQWEKSGQPIKTFCAQHGFSDSVFHTWLNKFRRNKNTSVEQQGFLPLQVAPNVISGEDHRTFAEIILPGGTRIKLY